MKCEYCDKTMGEDRYVDDTVEGPMPVICAECYYTKVHGLDRGWLVGVHQEDNTGAAPEQADRAFRLLGWKRETEDYGQDESTGFYAVAIPKGVADALKEYNQGIYAEVLGLVVELNMP